MERASGFAASSQFPGILRAAVQALKAVGRFILMMSEAGPRAAAVRRLNAMTDLELESRGLTRAGEVDRIFRYRFYV